MTPSPPRIMPIAMQIEMLKKFVHDCDTIDIDWAHEVDSALSLPENRVEMSIIHPECKWFKDEDERRNVKQEALKETEDYIDYLQSIVPPEATEDFQEFFDDYLTRYRYALERKLKISGIKRRVKDLEIELEEAKRKREITPERPPTVKPPPKPRPLTWTTTLERKLRDIFEATFTRAGLSPRKYLPEYRVELEEVIKGLPTQEEMKKAVEELAKEIIRRERVPKIKPPVIRPPRPPRIPPEVPIWREEVYEPFVYPPVAMSEMRFPRRPAGIEVDQIYAKFENDLLACGIAVPRTYRSTFEIWENHTYESWKQMRDIYELMVQKLCKGQRFTRKDLPVRIPYEAICEGVYWIVSQKWAESVEDIVRKLDELGTPATRETIKDCIRQGWRERVPNFVIVTKDYLEHLLAEPLELK